MRGGWFCSLFFMDPTVSSLSNYWDQSTLPVVRAFPCHLPYKRRQTSLLSSLLYLYVNEMSSRLSFNRIQLALRGESAVWCDGSLLWIQCSAVSACRVLGAFTSLTGWVNSMQNEMDPFPQLIDLIFTEQMYLNWNIHIVQNSWQVCV